MVKELEEIRGVMRLQFKFVLDEGEREERKVDGIMLNYGIVLRGVFKLKIFIRGIFYFLGIGMCQYFCYVEFLVGRNLWSVCILRKF